MSAQTLVYMTIISIIITAVILWFYYTSQPPVISFSSFCSWYQTAFHTLQKELVDEPWVPWIIMWALPFFCYFTIISSAIATITEIKKFESVLNLKSVNFETNKVFFNFNRPQYNFVCGYGDINNVEMELITAMMHTKSGSYPALAKITVNFTVLNNKKFSLTSNTFQHTKKIYQIVDCGKAAQNFSYKFTGAGRVDTLAEKIEDYKNTGCKQILATQTEVAFKWFSIAFFSIGLCFFFAFRKEFSNSSDLGLLSIVGIPVLSFIGLSFIFDIILLADKWNESKYKRF